MTSFVIEIAKISFLKFLAIILPSASTTKEERRPGGGIVRSNRYRKNRGELRAEMERKSN